MTACACGCGRETVRAQYARGHNPLSHKGNKGRRLTPAQRESLRSTNLGRKRSPEAIRKTSLAVLRRFHNGAIDHGVIKKDVARRNWAHKLKVLYRLTVADFAWLWHDQEGKCALCFRPLFLEQHGYAVDHCHRTNLVRGILCVIDNGMLGRIEQTTLSAVTAYLSRTL